MSRKIGDSAVVKILFSIKALNTGFKNGKKS